MTLINYYDTQSETIDGDPYAPVFIGGIHGVDKCPFCQINLKEDDLITSLHLEAYSQQLKDQERSISFKALSCPQCGWFQLIKSINDYDYKDHGYQRIVRSIIKEFDLSSREAPLRELSNYLAKKPGDIYHIHSQKMEELVCAVFKEHFNCEVIHCGRSGDKGIDLFLVLSDELIPVQVKRRMHPGRTEPVDTVLKMLGVMYRDGFRKAKIVSTAERYSPSAIEDAQNVVDNGKADSIELLNLQDFLAIMRQYYHGNESSYIDVAKTLIQL